MFPTGNHSGTPRAKHFFQPCSFTVKLQRENEEKKQRIKYSQNEERMLLSQQWKVK